MNPCQEGLSEGGLVLIRNADYADGAETAPVFLVGVVTRPLPQAPKNMARVSAQVREIRVSEQVQLSKRESLLTQSSDGTCLSGSTPVSRNSRMNQKKEQCPFRRYRLIRSQINPAVQ